MSVIIRKPEPMPRSGIRRLTTRESILRSNALDCIRGISPAQCQGQLHINIFFDGTGNNQDEIVPPKGRTQAELMKHSNVARLFNARIDDPKKGFYSFYVPGIGTEFKEIDDKGGSFSAAVGYMGADRINWAITRVYNAVSEYLSNALLIDDETTKKVVREVSPAYRSQTLTANHRNAVFRTLETKLDAVIDKSQRQILQINLAVFGFSRGSAQARTFANWLAQLLYKADGGYFLLDIPFRFYFMGIFETVASVGPNGAIPSVKGHWGWADGQMNINQAVESCVHFIALHEQRGSFPLEMAENVKQIIYPGMHSDVGGGYLPKEQGKSGQISQVTLTDMHYEAIKAGVPLLSSAEIKAKPDKALDFELKSDVIAAVNAFWRDCGIDLLPGTNGALETIRQHTLQYLQWRGGLLATGQTLQAREFFMGAEKADQRDMSAANHVFSLATSQFRDRVEYAQGGMSIRFQVALRNGYSSQSEIPPNFGYVPVETKKMIDSVNNYAALPTSIVYFMDNYIHDSRAGSYSFERLNTYYKYRSVYQNSWPIEVEGTEESLDSSLRSESPSDPMLRPKSELKK